MGDSQQETKWVQQKWSRSLPKKQIKKKSRGSDWEKRAQTPADQLREEIVDHRAVDHSGRECLVNCFWSFTQGKNKWTVKEMAHSSLSPYPIGTSSLPAGRNHSIPLLVFFPPFSDVSRWHGARGSPAYWKIVPTYHHWGASQVLVGGGSAHVPTTHRSTAAHNRGNCAHRKDATNQMCRLLSSAD